MIKIVHVITCLNKGGAERSLYNFIVNKKTIGKHIIISLKDIGYYGKLLKSEGLIVNELNINNFYDFFSKLFYLNKIINKLEPDIIQGWMYHGNLIAFLISIFSFKKKKCVWNIRMSLHKEKKTYNKKIDLINKFCAIFSWIPSKIIFNSYQSMKDHKDIGYLDRNFYFIENGFNTDYWKPSLSTRRKFRQKNNFDENNFVIGFVGRFDEVKNLELLIDSFLRIENIISKARLICIGDNLKQNFTHIKSSKIVFLDFQSNIKDWICSFDILCLPSKVEGFANVLGESMSCEVPCIASNIGDSARVISDAGWIFESEDKESLIDLLITIYNLDKKKLKFIARKARRRIIENYSLSKTVSKYNSLYKSIIF